MRSLLFLSLSTVLIFAQTHTATAAEIAKVGKISLTSEALMKKLGKLPKMQKNFLNRDENARTRLVENFVMEELFVQEAVHQGVSKSAEFRESLENQRRQLLARAFLKKSVESKMDDSRIKRHFNKNKQKYRTDEVHAFHILLKTKPQADEVYGLAKKTEKNSDFQDLAKKHSKDPSAAQNMGDLGFFQRSRMVPEFANAAFGMKKGQISKPVKSPFGWHVIKVVDTKKGKDAVFKDVKIRVKSDLRSSLMKKLVDDLKKKLKVSTNESVIKGLKF